MAISFNSIPSNLRVPFAAVEFDSSQANQGSALLAYKAILIGQKLAAGTATADTIVRVSSIADVIALAGRGSILHRQAIGWFASNKFTELWLGVLADNGAGTAATGTIVVAGSAPATGTVPPIVLYFGAVRIVVGVNNGDTANTIATNIAAAITAVPDLPITASAATATVTLTFRHKGTAGNSYDVRHSFNFGESLPSGVTLTITALSGGVTNPVLTNLIAAMADMWFQIWSHPYTDATSLTAIETELGLRIGPMRQQDGVAITSASGTLSSLATLGTGRNSPSSVIVAQTGASPLTPPMEFAAEVAALVALAAAADPARPFQTLAMSNAIATAQTDKFDATERNTLLFDGIATTKFSPGGGVQLDRIITTYQLNPSGQADTAYLDATTPLTLLYVRFDFRNRMTTKYPRHKLADDGTRFASGQAVMTPSLGRAEALQWFRDNEALGLLQNFDAFKANLVVERDATNRNQLNFLLPPTLINQLVVTAAKIQFRL